MYYIERFLLCLYVRFTCTRKGGILLMILSFLDKETEKVFHQEFSRKLPESIQQENYHDKDIHTMYVVEVKQYLTNEE